MLRLVLALLIAASAGCQICQSPKFKRPAGSADVWNTAYLIDVDPGVVTTADLSSRAALLEQRYWAFGQINGVIWQPSRSVAALADPDMWANSADSGLYTGMALATFCFQYKATRSAAALDNVLNTLRGVYILTHASGKPGVIQRNSFPTSDGARVGYPSQWQSRIDAGFVHSGAALSDPLGGPDIPPQTYYTRGTKDQLTGLLLGLAAAWSTFEPSLVDPSHVTVATAVREVASGIVLDIHHHLKLYDWRIRDEFGKNDTNADYVDHLIRTNVLALLFHMGFTSFRDKYDETFDGFMRLAPVFAQGDRFNNYSQYFAHNLRACQAMTIWLLEGPSTSKGRRVADYLESNLWEFVEGHKNSWFAFLQAIMNGDGGAADEGLYALKSLSLKPVRMWSSPYHGQYQPPNPASAAFDCTEVFVVDPHLRKPESYSTWSKEPWDTGENADWDKDGLRDTTGLDFLLAYWLGRAYGIF